MSWFGRIWNAALKAGPLRLWALIAAGPAITAIWIGFGLVIWKGNWAPELEPQQLDFVGYGFLIAGGLVATVIVSLARVRLKVSKDGLEADSHSDDEPA